MSKWFKHKNVWFNLDKFLSLSLHENKEIFLKGYGITDMMDFETMQERDEAFHEIGTLLRR